MMDSILFREEDELVKLLEEKLVAEGVNLYTSTKAVDVNEVNNKIILKVERNNDMEILEGDAILLGSW